MERNPFLEFVKDKDEYAMARFLALAKQMIAEGRRPVSLLMAMMRTSREIAYEERGEELLECLTRLSKFAEEERAKVAQVLAESEAWARAIVEAEDAV
jgi:hypothetical protein